jgi:hypothetical protein
MIGVEAVDNILFGTKEFTLLYPSLVNKIIVLTILSNHPSIDYGVPPSSFSISCPLNKISLALITRI